MSALSVPRTTDRWNRVASIAILATLAILLLNPWGVLGSRVIAGYKGWQEERRIARIWNDLATAPSYLGPSPAPGRGVIVEFVDYDCPVCRTVAPAVSGATRNQQVSVIVRHVPSARGGSAATEAALAAICAERYDLFPEAHEALVSNEAWLSTRDWVGFGLSLGIGDSESFRSCMGEEATQLRLARDVEFAGLLRIPGTPTFVSVEGLHPGAAGLAEALAAASRAAPPRDHAALRPATESLFDSSEHPELAELRHVTAGIFLSDTALALVDRTEIQIVDLTSGQIRGVGREGEGPEEFGRIAGAVRTPAGIAVWDIMRYRVAFVARDGSFLRSRGYLDVPFKGFANVRPVAAHPDGRVLFRDQTGGSAERFEGRIRHPVYFVAVGSDDSLQVVIEAQGDEEHYGKIISDRVIFGHRTLEAATGDRLLVAETDRQAIAVLDWNGQTVAVIPMPAAVRPSADQVRMARWLMEEAWEETREQVMRMSAEGRLPYPDTDRADFPTVPPDWPANETAPPIDAMLTDFDTRLWVRDYRLPGQDSVTWRVWDIDRTQLLFTARMDGEDTLLDARGDFVLVRRLDEFGVPRAVVSRLRPGGHE